MVIHKDKTTSQIKDLLKDLGRTVNGDCFICCVLSHGKSEGVYGTDDNLVSVDEIREPFNGSNCRNLAGKPKLFFIQACRGRKNQKLVYVQADDPEEAEPELEVDAHRVEVSVPADSDFLIARSTIDGHFSYRSTKKGSWFIQSLCQQLKTHCPQWVWTFFPKLSSVFKYNTNIPVYCLNVCAQQKYMINGILFQRQTCVISNHFITMLLFILFF